MKYMSVAVCLVLVTLPLVAKGEAPPVQVTIPERGLAAVHEKVPLTLTVGSNKIDFTQIPSQVEPDSVLLRAPAELSGVRLTEQQFDAGMAGETGLLRRYEGKELDFEAVSPNGERLVRRGRVVQVPQDTTPGRPQSAPLVEVNGVLQYGTPGRPLFPAGEAGPLPTPALHWTIEAAAAATASMDLTYLTAGISWDACHTIVFDEDSGAIDFATWLNIDNRSGRDYCDAEVTLAAGKGGSAKQARNDMSGAAGYEDGRPDPRFYTDKKPEPNDTDLTTIAIKRPLTLPTGQTRQLSLVQATGIAGKLAYEYNGPTPTKELQDRGAYNGLRDRVLPVRAATAPRMVVTLDNSEANKLGVALPKARTHLYHMKDGRPVRVEDGAMDAVAVGAPLVIGPGPQPDIRVDRTQTDFTLDPRTKTLIESFSLAFHNGLKTEVVVRVIETLYRAQQWEITTSSLTHLKTGPQTAEFQVQLKPGEDKNLTYTVQYVLPGN